MVQPRPPARIMLTKVQATGKSCSRAVSLASNTAISLFDERELVATFCMTAVRQNTRRTRQLRDPWRWRDIFAPRGRHRKRRAPSAGVGVLGPVDHAQRRHDRL